MAINPNFWQTVNEYTVKKKKVCPQECHYNSTFTTKWMLTRLIVLYCEDCAPVTGQAPVARTANSNVIGCAQLMFFDWVEAIDSFFLLGEKRKQKSSTLGITTTSGLFWIFHDAYG